LGKFVQRYKIEAQKLIKLATPVLIASIAQTGMGFVDTIMAGGASASDMAAVAVASGLWFPIIFFGIGVLMAIIPVIAQLNGAGKQHQISFEVQQGIYIALLLLVPIILILFQTHTILSWMGVEIALREKCYGYMTAMMFGAPAFLFFQALRNLTDGMSMTRPTMVIGFMGLLLNIPLNWMFVYGKFGLPALGGVGCGVATMIVYWFMAISLFVFIIISKRLSHLEVFRQIYRPDKIELAKLFRLGLPVSASIFFEVTLFAVVTLMVSSLGSDIVAAHQVAINFSSLVFMLPMSIGSAVTIRVGHTLGEGKSEGAVVAAKVGLGTGVLLACMTAIITVLLSEHIARMYTDNYFVITLATHLLQLSALYQCADAVQVISAGALRGYKDMKAIFYITFTAYWIFGLPFGYMLGLTDWIIQPLGVSGFWIGIIIGLSLASLLLGSRLRWIFRKSQTSALEPVLQ
jgi:MATE family multidrug resistance protein